MLDFVRIEVGAGKPLGCTLCSAADSAAYHPTADIATEVGVVAAEWSGAPGPNVALVGPEPFAHPELPALVAACVEAGAERIAVETDGAALSISANAAGVLLAGVHHLRVTILDSDPERGDLLGGRAGRTRDALAGVRTYLAAAEEAGIAVVLTAVVPVCEHNIRELPDTIARIAAGGFHAARLQTTGEVPAGASALIGAACDTGMVNRLWVEVDPGLPIPDAHRLHSVAETVHHG